MCGIAGNFSYRRSALPVDQKELTTIRDYMAARGPDGAGLWISADQRIGLAHRRLSIIDLSTGGDLTIRELAEALANAVGFTGAIESDRRKPDGTPRKLMDSSRMRALTWKPQTPLREGLRTIAVLVE